MSASSSEGNTGVQINRPPAAASNGKSAKPSSLAESEAYCRAIARGHYENFLVASILLPRQMRQPFYNIYAFCRHADDLADESPSPQIALDGLARCQQQLDACFEGQAEHPIFVALCDSILRFDLDQRPFDDLIDAFRQDQFKTRYETFSELLDYCQRSANPVGRIVLRLAKADSAENIALSDRICTGLQLANHWQDIRRDFLAGRIYLPRDEMAACGVDESMLAGDRAAEPLKRLVAQECLRAREFLAGGLPLAQRVPRWLAADIRLFVHGGLATLQAVAALDHDVLRRRPTVSRWKQLRLTLWAVLGRL